MLQRETEIVNKLGLHARASAKLTQVASGFESDIWLSRSGKERNPGAWRALAAMALYGPQITIV